jgi:hypothetical protein
MAGKSPTRTLAPRVEFVHVIDRGPTAEGETPEERVYRQQELSLLQTFDLFELLMGILLDPASGIDLEEVLALDLNTATGLSTLVGKLMRLGPNLVARLIAILLNAADDADWLLNNLTPAATIEILRTGVQQNDLSRLLADFFALRGDVTKALSQAQTPA